jgi:hypothetical protein
MYCAPSLLLLASSAPQHPPLATELLLHLLSPGCSQTIDTSTRLYTAPETSPFATELLSRLLGGKSAETIVTSLENSPSSSLSGAMIDDPKPTAARYDPASRYCGETRRRAQSSAGSFDGWRAHLILDPPTDRPVLHEFFNDESGRHLLTSRW